MANTPREQPAYIVLGIIKHKDGHWEGKGLRLCRKITFLIYIGFTVQNALKTEKLFFGRD